jgi:hypothetical protein
MNALNNASLSPDFLKSYPDIDPVHSKLHFLYEKGNKCRVIAIVDYYTQEALSHIHTVLAEILKGLPMDYTFDQEAGFKKVLDWSQSSSHTLYSFDLSAATDRLPLSLQEDLLSHIFGVREAAAWASLISSRNWSTPMSTIVRYKVGQPMGTKSSFPMLALTHHIIVQMCALKAGLTGFNEYAILGDDIVIAHSGVAKHYTKYMLDLGVGINMNKSVLPTNEAFSGAEFASRLAMNGVDLSPLPIKLFSKVFTDSEYLPQLQNELSRSLGTLNPESY